MILTDDEGGSVMRRDMRLELIVRLPSIMGFGMVGMAALLIIYEIGLAFGYEINLESGVWNYLFWIFMVPASLPLAVVLVGMIKALVEGGFDEEVDEEVDEEGDEEGDD